MGSEAGQGSAAARFAYLVGSEPKPASSTPSTKQEPSANPPPSLPIYRNTPEIIKAESLTVKSEESEAPVRFPGSRMAGQPS
jgi:hypothetical protein